MLNPFGTIFESLDGPNGPVVESVHQAAFERLVDLVNAEEGHLISLRAPRAGYGKTMLLARLAEKIKGRMTLVPIHLIEGQRMDSESILEEMLTRLTETVPTMAGLTRLDLCIRKLFAQGLLPLVHSGEVPCQDKESSVASLRENPVEAFDFHQPDAAIAQWSKDQFEALSPRLSYVLSKASGASSRDTTYWLDLFFKFATRPTQDLSRIENLMNAVFGWESRFRSGSRFLEGLGSFLNLISLVEPVILVLDEVDGLFSNDEAALRATSSLVSLWENCRRVNVIVSVNDDVWESAFAPKLPHGLRDRFEDTVIRLKPLSMDDASSLVAARAGSESNRIIGKLDLSSGDLYARGVLKAAREVWEKRDHLEDGPGNSGASQPMIHGEPERESETGAGTATEDFAEAGFFADQGKEKFWGENLAAKSTEEPEKPKPEDKMEGFLAEDDFADLPPAPFSQKESPETSPLPVADPDPPATPEPVRSPFQPSPFELDVPSGGDSTPHQPSKVAAPLFDDALGSLDSDSDNGLESWDLDTPAKPEKPETISSTQKPAGPDKEVVQKSPFEIVKPAPSGSIDSPPKSDPVDDLLRRFKDSRDL